MLWTLRGIFLLLMVAMSLYSGNQAGLRFLPLFVLAAAIVAVVIIVLDVATPRKSLAALSGALLGLMSGMLIAYAAGLIIELMLEAFNPIYAQSPVVNAVKLMIGVVSCYVSISLILQTKDDFRFVVPYVEFAKQSRGSRPLILDTSVIIDGRVADICETRIVDAAIIIPRFVLQELQAIADSSDKLKRTRGRRGLDMLNKLQTNERMEIKISDARLPALEEDGEVDEKLVALAKKLDGRVVTNDYNLNKIAQLRGVDVININDLANALKPVVLPGESVVVKIIKAGEEVGQGVGYLEDGTMVVAENSRERINEEVALTVTSVLQTSAGRMIFGRPEGMPPAPRRGSGGSR